MNGTKSKDKPLVVLDSSILIYHSSAHPEFGPKTIKVLEPIALGKSQGIISTIAVTEVLTMQKKQVNRPAMLTLQKWLLGLVNISIIDITLPIAIKAAEIRQEYGFKTPDALHLATAKLMNAKTFYTNDKKLLKYKGIKVKLL